MKRFIALLIVYAAATANVSPVVGSSVGASATVSTITGPVATLSGLGTASIGSLSYGVTESTVAVTYPMLGAGPCFPAAGLGVASLCYGVASPAPVFSFSSTSVSYTLPAVRYDNHVYMQPNIAVSIPATLVTYTPPPKPVPTVKPINTRNAVTFTTVKPIKILNTVAAASASVPVPVPVPAAVSTPAHTDDTPVADFPVFDTHDTAPSHTYSETEGYVYKRPKRVFKH